MHTEPTRFQIASAFWLFFIIIGFVAGGGVLNTNLPPLVFVLLGIPLFWCFSTLAEAFAMTELRFRLPFLIWSTAEVLIRPYIITEEGFHWSPEAHLLLLAGAAILSTALTILPEYLPVLEGLKPISKPILESD